MQLLRFLFQIRNLAFQKIRRKLCSSSSEPPLQIALGLRAGGVFFYEDIAQYLTKGNGGVVNSSRGILLAYKKQPGTAFDEAAYNECVNMKEAIAHACSLL